MALHVHCSQICRFCLSQDWDKLVQLNTIINSTLTLQDIKRFTGIKNLEEENKPYVLCGDCHIKLINSVTFRHSCLANEAFFREFCLGFEELADSHGEETEKTTAEPNESVSEIEFIVVNKRKKRKIVTMQNDLLERSERLSCEFEETETTHDFDYCANRIEPGEPSSSDEECSEKPQLVRNKVAMDRNTLFIESMRLIKATQQRQEVARIAASSAVESKSSTSHLVRDRCSKAIRSQLCDVCGKVVHKLSDHMSIHTKEMRYACPHCPVRMANHGNLYRHVQAVHMKRIMKTCKDCNKGFTSDGSYKSHMRSEHGIGETYECKLCPKKFNHPGNYRVHIIRCHSDERKFTCSICGKQFKEKRDHRNHQRVHSDDKPFACSQCPKGFKSEYARKTHELTHAGVVFKCTVCDKSYRYKCLLNIHIKKDHPEIKSADADN
ncbi:zinc finger protein 418-like [Anopheles moucheti]|uniref:zinc finger protein 418-like n=1 Tax=Anopheles moucheti TaxID=186751 RepID=UPI0022F0891A|nr:zinc finger protein 418-like [Anopheles moucheti]